TTTKGRCSSASCARVPTPSKAVPPRYCAISSASESWVCPMTCAPTPDDPGVRYPVADTSMTDQNLTATERFAFTPEQQELRTAVRRFCAEHSDEFAVRRLMESTPAFDQKAWVRLGSELGVLGLGVPEELDGSGGGIVDAAIAVEEL